MLFCFRRRLSVMAGFIIVCCFFFNFVIKQPNNEDLTLIEFTDEFSNETGADRYIVPNIIHFIRYQKFELNFVDYVVLKAAMRNHRPDHFYYHTNIKNVTYDGKYWDWVRKDEPLWSRIRVKYLEAPTEIFGQKLSDGWRFHHGSDIGRIRVLMQYGGIYLDNDCFVIRSLDKYRKFECALNWDDKQFMGTQTLIAHKNSRFIKLWLESYKGNYHSDRWYYNAGERPTTEILFQQPYLIHRVKGDFGAATGVSMSLYKNLKFDWRHLDVIHLLMNHRSYLDPNYNKTPVFDENNIRTYEYPFGDMVRHLLDMQSPNSPSP
ncbi:uncharacterized protein LOC124326253 isoform X2 [Daphnia pulicaria]|uniref:uncharacterized protein LOC124326253 isoform X2 n=1 Tax=Daphnia pulicaria TaxID=35523 RepID=UPI001EECBA81|nr:uncharacterized protein LOC124326253 isoform X2 [Daphnia pulicaria]